MTICDNTRGQQDVMPIYSQLEKGRRELREGGRTGKEEETARRRT